jgi:predicted MFS family arabinose efflux permease
VPPARPTSDRRLSFSLYVLLATIEALVVGVSPLLPAYEARLSLSGFSVSALLASSNLALLLAGMPAGLIAERIGVRRLTIISGVVLAMGGFAEAEPVSYGYLLVDRVIVGAAGGVFATTGLAWLSGLPEGRSSPVGTGITFIGVGLALGPGFIGVVAEVLGIGAPFIVMAVLIGVATLVLIWTPHAAPPISEEAHSPRLSAVLVAVRRRPELRAAMFAMSASAVASGAISVILPLELSQAGASTGTIGLILFVSGLGYIAASALVARLQGRVVNTRVAAIVSVLIGALLLPGSLSRAAAILVATVIIVTPFRGALSTICYQLAPRSAGDGVGAASIIGALNSLWGAVSVGAPLVAGAIFDAAGGRAAFAVAQLIVFMAAAATALSRREAVIAPAA